METFDFPYFTYATEYPESGFRMALGNSYQYTAAPTSPDQRLIHLYFETMMHYPCTVFKQNTIPTALSVGDLWIDTGSINYVKWSQDFGNSIWEKATTSGSSIPVVSTNFATAPDGTNTADRIQFQRINSAGTDYSVIYQPIPALTIAGLYTVWLKSNTGSNQNIVIRSSSSYIEVTVTNQWQRFSTPCNIATNEIQLILHDSFGSVLPLIADILVWQAQVTPTTSPARDIQTFNSPVSTVGSNKPYRWTGTTWTLSNSNIQVNINKQPEINAGRLDAFYNFHKLNKKFIFPHPIYGDMAVRFNKPLVLPKGNKGGNGSLEAFELEFIEIPGGL